MNLSEMTIQQLTDLYNAKSGKAPISKFRSKGEAVRRAKALLAQGGGREDSRVITHVAENPKRPGSASHARYALYGVGMSVSDFIAAGGRRADVNWDLSHGFIRVE